MRIVIFEDSKYKNFYPISRTRNLSELRTGVYTQRERLEKIFNRKVLSYSERNFFTDDLDKKTDTLFLNARIKDFSTVRKLEKGSCIKSGDDYVAYRSPEPLLPEQLEGLEIIERNIPLYDYIWDVIGELHERLKIDLREMKNLGEIRIDIPDSVVLRNKNLIFTGENSIIGEGSVIDASDGPVFIRKNSEIGASTVIKGPTFIGENCFVKPGSLLDVVSAGRVTKMSGEIEETIFQGYSNKQHFGFLGHSYIGEWVNLGAGTTNSDLKNNYSKVRVKYVDKEISTGMQFLGLIMGDHSKTAINTSFNTGTIVEPFCNIFGRTFPPKYLPPFSWWGGEFAEYRLDKAIETAATVMERRNIKLDKNYEQMLRRLFENTASLREKSKEE